jgi:xanthine dehydrogenase molybdopterin-binding subunit B
MPGVLRFITAKDIPGVNNFIGAVDSPEQIFCDGEAAYAGQGVGVIIAGRWTNTSYTGSLRLRYLSEDVHTQLLPV